MVCSPVSGSYVTGVLLIGREEIDAGDIQKRVEFTGFNLKLREMDTGMADNDFQEKAWVEARAVPRVDFKEGTMQSKYFSNRNQCPVCTSKRFRELYKTPFDEPPVSDYLRSFSIFPRAVSTLNT